MTNEPHNGHDKTEATRIAVDDRNGKVIWQFSKPTQNMVLDPQNAFDIAEATARAAHRARFPGESLPDGSYLGHQIKARLTEALHDRMVVRVKAMLPSLIRKETNLDYIAREVVSQIFSEVDR